ncbi:ATP-dependent nuclease, subunit B / ATP-dependent nuclease, subunit A [plant metagenome]|uniref:ATP-dependent nuclease, subunit B / ATP-dependent nuclease, subunit A n=1 Tax=plant metagenome TaxID=1297885 RepID=A0A484U472_9ZZZZ
MQHGVAGIDVTGGCQGQALAGGNSARGQVQPPARQRDILPCGGQAAVAQLRGAQGQAALAVQFALRAHASQDAARVRQLAVDGLGVHVASGKDGAGVVQAAACIQRGRAACRQDALVLQRGAGVGRHLAPSLCPGGVGQRQAPVTLQEEVTAQCSGGARQHEVALRTQRHAAIGGRDAVGRQGAARRGAQRACGLGAGCLRGGDVALRTGGQVTAQRHRAATQLHAAAGLQCRMAPCQRLPRTAQAGARRGGQVSARFKFRGRGEGQAAVARSQRDVVGGADGALHGQCARARQRQAVACGQRAAEDRVAALAPRHQAACRLRARASRRNKIALRGDGQVAAQRDGCPGELQRRARHQRHVAVALRLARQRQHLPRLQRQIARCPQASRLRHRQRPARGQHQVLACLQRTPHAGVAAGLQGQRAACGQAAFGCQVSRGIHAGRGARLQRSGGRKAHVAVGADFQRARQCGQVAAHVHAHARFGAHQADAVGVHAAQGRQVDGHARRGALPGLRLHGARVVVDDVGARDRIDPFGPDGRVDGQRARQQIHLRQARAI